MSDDKPSKKPTEEQAPAPPGKRSWRRRLAVPVLIIAVAVLMAYWSRTKDVDVTVVYDLGKHAPRARRLSASFQREGGDVGQPVDWEFPAGATPQRRHRNKLSLKPGTYVVRARLHLRALGNRPAEVRKLRRSIEIASGSKQRITLRFR